MKQFDKHICVKLTSQEDYDTLIPLLKQNNYNQVKYNNNDFIINTHYVIIYTFKEYQILASNCGYEIMKIEDLQENVIPEYIECIQNNSNIKVGKIYKCYRISGLNSLNSPYYISYFKPSTKEAFDNQNKPKDVQPCLASLPDKWCIKTNKENLPDLQNYYNNNLSKYIDCKSYYEIQYNCLFYSQSPKPSIHSVKSEINNYNDFTIITFDEFKKWVLKEPYVAYQGDIDPYKRIDPISKSWLHLIKYKMNFENEDRWGYKIWMDSYENLSSKYPLIPKDCIKPLEFQQPVIIKSKKSKFKLIIINQ